MNPIARNLVVMCLMIVGSPSASTGAQEVRQGQAPAKAVSDWPIPFDEDAQRVYQEDYENGKCDRILPDSSAAVVSREDGVTVHAGKYYLRLNSAPLVRDGIALLKVDGRLYIDLHDVPFIHTVPQTWNRMALPSMFGGGTPPLESFGWQLDDLEIWDGLPDPAKRTESPSPQ